MEVEPVAVEPVEVEPVEVEPEGSASSAPQMVTDSAAAEGINTDAAAEAEGFAPVVLEGGGNAEADAMQASVPCPAPGILPSSDRTVDATYWPGSVHATHATIPALSPERVSIEPMEEMPTFHTSSENLVSPVQQRVEAATEWATKSAAEAKAAAAKAAAQEPAPSAPRAAPSKSSHEVEEIGRSRVLSAMGLSKPPVEHKRSTRAATGDACAAGTGASHADAAKTPNGEATKRAAPAKAMPFTRGLYRWRFLGGEESWVVSPHPPESIEEDAYTLQQGERRLARSALCGLFGSEGAAAGAVSNWQATKFVRWAKAVELFEKAAHSQSVGAQRKPSLGSAARLLLLTESHVDGAAMSEGKWNRRQREQWLSVLFRAALDGDFVDTDYAGTCHGAILLESLRCFANAVDDAKLTPAFKAARADWEDRLNEEKRTAQQNADEYAACRGPSQKRRRSAAGAAGASEMEAFDATGFVQLLAQLCDGVHDWQADAEQLACPMDA